MSESTAIEVRVDHAEIRLDKHEKVHQRIYDGLDRLSKRPPAWVTPVVSSMALIIGWLLHMAIA